MADSGDIYEATPFSEKAFYLQEFRGRTLGITVADRATAQHVELRRVLEELRDNGTRVVLVGPTEAVGSLRYETLGTSGNAGPHMPGKVWRALQRYPCVCIAVDEPLSQSSLQVAAALRLFKLVRLAPMSGVADASGRPRSFVDRLELEQLLAMTSPRSAAGALLHEIAGLLAAGMPSVNLCRVEDLGDELFSYAGSGTLFTAERYVMVRRFGIEDYDAAADLIARGTAEGFLAPRSGPQIDMLLADGFGAFVSGQHLAGIGALRVPPGAFAGEVASLYTLTRFAGGGVGAHLVSFAIEQAESLGLRFVYACTTFDRVGSFFERLGFRRVDWTEIPDEKWAGYDHERRARLRCYRRDLTGNG